MHYPAVFLRKSLPLLLWVSLGLAACERRSATFRAGDRVTVKLVPDTTGIVVARLRPFQDDLYYLRVSGSSVDMDRSLPHELEWTLRSEEKRDWHVERPLL